MTTKLAENLALISAVVTTGEESCMTTDAWSFLAENQNFFTTLACLTRHQAVLEKESLSTKTTIDEALVTKLVEDVEKIVSKGCIPCNIGEDVESWTIFMNQDYHKAAMKILDESDNTDLTPRTQLSKSGIEIDKQFFVMLTMRLQEAGIHPAELAEFATAFKWEPEYEQNIRWGECCCSNNQFKEIISMLVRQRKILSLMNS